MVQPSFLSSAANSSHVYDQLQFSAYYIQMTFLLNLVCSLGISIYGFSALANTIVCLVFFLDGFKSTSNISFFALGITDVLMSIIWALFNVRVHSKLGKPFYDLFKVEVWKYLIVCADALGSSGSWITAIITWERLCCIAFPLKVKRIFTRKLIMSLILGGLVFQVLAMTFYLVADHKLQQGYKEEVYVFYIDGKYYNKTEIVPTGSSTMLYISRLLLTSIPNYVLYAAIVIGTALLIAVFLRSVQRKKSLTSVAGPEGMTTKEKKLVLSVIAICMVYIVTCTPRNVYFTLLALIGEDISLPSAYQILSQGSIDIMLSLNPALNIFVYLGVNSSFRRQIRKLLCFCCYVEPPTTSIKTLSVK
ncbi:chemosensory receptor B [Elysia marginata]|uniref:Chemosensory receptor B n=1 Tax=Elysia marginata TaxID=1093978 RepID=A0AAV4ERC6_9GAST|nr:chemosensory receptor B [Elysia marginata]